MPSFPDRRSELFFRSTVRPTVEEFLAEERDLRRGRLAAIVLHHMADYAALEGYEGNDRRAMDVRLNALRQELIGLCPDYSLIHDIADASKHARLSVPKHGARQVSTAAQVTRPPGLFGMPFGYGNFAEAAVTMTVGDGGLTVHYWYS